MPAEPEASPSLLCRSTPWAAQKEKDESTSTVVQVLMVSESNVCRSVLAEAIMRQQLADCGLSSMVQVQSKVTPGTAPTCVLSWHTRAYCVVSQCRLFTQE